MGRNTLISRVSPAISENECFKGSNANLMLDVKMAETGIPKFFGFSPLETVHGWARVQLQQILSLIPTLPFAIPDVRPKQVAVTFVNNATGAALTPCRDGCVFPLTGPTLSGGLKDLEYERDDHDAGRELERRHAGRHRHQRRLMRGGVDPTTYTCFDDGSNAGLVALRSYDATTAGSQGSPILRAVTPTTCSGTPFFSDYQATAGNCSYGVTATVDLGRLRSLPRSNVRATVNGTRSDPGEVRKHQHVGLHKRLCRSTP